MLRSNNNNNNNKEEEEEEVRPIDGEYKKYTPPKPLHEQLNFSISDFVTVKHLGDGSYSEVRMVNFDALRLEGTEKSSRIRQEFLERPIALKVMDKKFIQRENKMSYVTKERDVLNAAEFTGICKLFFTFQD